MFGRWSLASRSLLLGVAFGVVGFAEEARAEERRSWCCPDVALAPTTFARGETTLGSFDEVVFPWRERTVPSAEPWLDGSDVVVLETYPEAASAASGPRAPRGPWFPEDTTLSEPWL